MEKISLCGDDCLCCPRYLAKTDEECAKVAELWYRVGWRDRIVSNTVIKCTGCSSHKNCSYGLVACITEHGADKCSSCSEFQCEKIRELLKKSDTYKMKCRQVCSEEEFQMLERSFFNKEVNLKK